MKRRVTVRCAAANDDEGGSSASGDERPPAARQRKASPPQRAPRPAAPETSAGGPRRKKEKEFAWMDSEEEDDNDDGEAGASPDAKEAGDEEKEEEDEALNTQVLDSVQSFGRMMLLAPAITKWLQGGTVSPDEVGATCRAMSRTKFFDGDMLKDLKEVLMRMLAADQLDVPSVHDAVMCLWELNAYDKRLFSAVAKALRPKVVFLEQRVRCSWLEVYRGFGHSHEKDFLQLLEVPPLLPTSPAYLKIRCRFFDKASCCLGPLCTYSHDPRAPVSLEVDSVGRSSPLVMTQNQYSMGRETYGGTFQYGAKTTPFHTRSPTRK